MRTDLLANPRQAIVASVGEAETKRTGVDSEGRPCTSTSHAVLYFFELRRNSMAVELSNARPHRIDAEI